MHLKVFIRNGLKYANAIKSWKDNWDKLTAYFDYP